jgi:hypothetical protein
LCAAPSKAPGFPGPFVLLGHPPFRQDWRRLSQITGLNHIDHASHQNGATSIDRDRPCIWIRTDAELTAITISGAIDASDIEELSPYARGLIRDCGALVVELSGTDFIAVDALRALFALWSADPATTEQPRSHVMRICTERLTVELRRGE